MQFRATVSSCRNRFQTMKCVRAWQACSSCITSVGKQLKKAYLFYLWMWPCIANQKNSLSFDELNFTTDD